ncbi:unnamed protein product [Schistocephalus solidus]|uniref:Uncharacterized protein n=1 Tax=Schistocephalus solidus TaxID=70667 RepID=A0A183TQC2_SCHSO|nr:unnamed protein product [Schistocephalus solidus]
MSPPPSPSSDLPDSVMITGSVEGECGSRCASLSSLKTKPQASGKCSCGSLYLVPNALPCLPEAELCPAATPQATATTGVLNQARVSSVVSVSTPGRAEYKGNCGADGWMDHHLVISKMGCHAGNLKVTTSADGPTVLTQILKRWAEHLRSVLNWPSTIFDAATD